MTREEARKAAEVMLAYANGEEIEAMCLDGQYKHIKNPSFNYWSSTENYRVKPKTKYRPFKTREECWQEMLKHKPFGWITDGYYKSTISVKSNSIVLTISSDEYLYADAFHAFRFADGEPFGVNEE